MNATELGCTKFTRASKLRSQLLRILIYALPSCWTWELIRPTDTDWQFAVPVVLCWRDRSRSAFSRDVSRVALQQALNRGQQSFVLHGLLKEVLGASF